MEILPTILNRPIHIGKYVWDDTKEGVHELCLLSDNGLVYATMVTEFSKSLGQYFLFHYDDEDSAVYIGPLKEFEYVHWHDYLDLENLELYGYNNPQTKAIIKADLGEHLFYYYISADYIINSNEDLCGYFSLKESYLLNYIFREDFEPITIEKYQMKKKEIENTLSSLNIGQFASSYNKEDHLDSMLFKYIREMIDKEKDYDRKYIAPKIMFWGI